ncbi:MAG: L,D-transpeptidase [Sphingopyxis sp.]|nr:L,D-transpeptidase [Sphingopyxis sp.]
MLRVLKIWVLAGLMALSANVASAAQLTVRVDISKQEMVVSHQGDVLHVWKVSTGRSGYRTPSGSWRPGRMHKTYFSRKYDNAPMPYAIFFTGGYAVHGTNHVKALGRPASHGCVRLQTRNAATLFSLVRQVGRGKTRIIVQQ